MSGAPQEAAVVTGCHVEHEQLDQPDDGLIEWIVTREGMFPVGALPLLADESYVSQHCN